MSARRTLTIGELAAETGRTVDTIRWYEKRGLVPRVARDKGGRRQYTDWHVEWFALIARLRATRMPVEEVRRYADLIQSGRTGIPAQADLLRAHREKICAQIEELKDSLALIDGKLANYDAWSVGRTPRPRSSS